MLSNLHLFLQVVIAAMALVPICLTQEESVAPEITLAIIFLSGRYFSSPYTGGKIKYRHGPKLRTSLGLLQICSGALWLLIGVVKNHNHLVETIHIPRSNRHYRRIAYNLGENRKCLHSFETLPMTLGHPLMFRIFEIFLAFLYLTLMSTTLFPTLKIVGKEVDFLPEFPLIM